MRPLVLLAAGLVLVGVDLRTEHIDVLADPLGWLLVAEGARRLSLRVPMCFAAAAAVASLAEVHLPYRRVRIDPETGEVIDGSLLSNAPGHVRFHDVTGVRLGLLVLAAVVAGVAIFVLLRALAERAAPADRRVAGRLRLLQWLVPALWTVPYVAVALASTDGFDPVWNDGREVLALAGLAALGVAAVLLLVHAGAGWALAPARRPRNLGTKGLAT